MIRALALLAVLAAGPAGAKIFGVIVGINAYARVTPLRGAVNDAADLAEVLVGQGAEVALLVDGAATRSDVVAAFRAATDRAVPGDMIVFSFAGHGFQQPEALPGDETDGLDEVFALQGFGLDGAAAGERLRDNDIAVLLAEAPPGVGVLFVADSCHSGTMTRAPFGMGSEALPTRSLKLSGPVTHDPLPPPPESSFRREAGDFGQVIFAAAARDGQETPEVVIDGQLRGALSYAVARALQGAAAGGDGDTSLADLRDYVRAEVRARTEAQQTPDVHLPEDGALTRTLRLVFNPGAPAVPDAEVRLEGPATGPGPEATAVRQLEPAPEPVLARINPGQEGAAPAEAALLWFTGSGELVDRVSGDLLALVTTEAEAEAALLKWRVARGLARWVPGRPADVMLAEGDGRHQVGDTLDILVAPPRSAPAMRWLVLVNLASDGTVQLVWPDAATVAAGGNQIPEPEDPLRLGPIPVEDPVGADSLLAILSREPHPALYDRLAALDGRQDPLGLMQVLAGLATDPTQVRVGLLPIFTAPGD